MIINFQTKWGNRLVQSDTRANIFSYILKERIEDGFWYGDAETERAQCHLADNKAEAFLHSRRDHEYEGYEQVTVENV